jgi:hypothetical protein
MKINSHFEGKIDMKTVKTVGNLRSGIDLNLRGHTSLLRIVQ